MNTLPEKSPHEGTTPISHQPAWTAVPEAAVPARVGEFDIVAKLGEGSFGQVFLARQGSLGRLVAIKILSDQADDRGEGQMLAGLEHDHIVKVYSTFADAPSGARGLCLQYVPGADLKLIIHRVHEGGRVPTSGQALLDALDAARRGESGFDPRALRDREALAGDDFAQAVCRVGARLAEALAFAHARNILHCDIKPANILVTPYGRPMLADFNVAFDRTRRPAGEPGYGGTLAYMAPEYRRAMTGQPGGGTDERCDVYSLGVVLHELATGKRPPAPTPTSPSAETLLDPHSGLVPKLTDEAADANDPLARVPRELAAVIRRCLAPVPSDRYQTAAELARALTGAWNLLAARRALPAPGRVGRWVSAHAALALVLAAALPNLAASAVQIGYNAVEVDLNPGQKRAFLFMVLAYNAVAYPLCLGTGVYLMLKVVRPLARLAALPGPAVDRLRRRARDLGWRAAGLVALGWFPGGVLFPVVIDAAAGPLAPGTYAHYAVSFTLAGLIGVVFTLLGMNYVLFRALLPRLGNPDTHTPAGVWEEVRPLTAPFGALVMLACAVPLAGAVLLIAFTGGYMSLGFRVLVVGLIGLGVAGVALAERVVRSLRRLAAVWQPVAQAESDSSVG